MRSDDSRTRYTAVRVFSRLPGEDVAAALLAAVDDPELSVRFYACEGVFSRWGLSAHVVPRRHLMMLRMRIHSDLESIRKPACAELRALGARLRAGQSPDALGLVAEQPIDSPALRAWLTSFRSEIDDAPYTEDFDLAALDALGAEDRAWAELALIGQLYKDDPRVPRALRHLESRLAVEPMRVLQRTKVAGAPQWWLDRSRRFVDELARALDWGDAAESGK